jgi:hypothetical protein
LDAHDSTEPVIDIVGRGKNTYLWIGEGDDTKPTRCFATITTRRARKLARAILENYPEDAGK